MEVKQEKPGLKHETLHHPNVAFNHQTWKIQSIYDQTRNVPSILGLRNPERQGFFIKHCPLSGWSCLEATQPQERKAVQLYVSLASKHLEESGSLRGGWGDEADHRRLRLGSSEIDGRQYKSFIRKKTHHCFITSCSIEIVSYCTSRNWFDRKEQYKTYDFPNAP